MYRILIVEDDMVIAKQMQKYLSSWNYDVTIVTDFQKVLDIFLEIEPELVLMDLTLPYFNGYYWTEMIRKTSSVPIMFISSASDNMNIVMAMSTGGDDFISKPFDLTVLVAKIQALLRRAYDFISKTSHLEYHGLRFNPGNHLVTYQEKSLELTKNEAKILKILLEHSGEIVERDTLMEFLWSTDVYIDENTLTVNVNRLRKRLEEIGVSDFIKTKKGIGYMI